MTDSNRQADALLTEHFQYTPLSLIDDIINAVNTIIYQAIEALENGLLQIPPRSLGFGRDKSSSATASADIDAEASVEIENGVHQLETLLESTVDRSFDIFEIWTLRNVLTIPDDLAPWMRLSHYENLELPLPSTAPTPESILLLRRKLTETRKLNRALQTTHTRNTALISQLNTLLSPPSATTPNPSQTPSLAFLTSPTNSTGTQPLNLSFTPKPLQTSQSLSTNAQFAISQLPALRKLVGELRPKVEKLKEGGLEGADAQRESRREERRKYIEDGVRRIVGKGGAEGEEMGGERRGREEVEGLEVLIRGMGGDGN